MHPHITTAAIAAGLLALSLSVAQADTKIFNLGHFDRISASSGLDVEVTVGQPQALHAESDDAEALDKLSLTVRNGQLEVEMDNRFLDFMSGIGKFFSGGPGITVYVTAPVVSELEAKSGSEIAATGMTGNSLSFDASTGSQIRATGVQAQFVAVDGSTGAAVDIRGSCGRLEADVSTGAFLKLGRLACTIVAVEASSGAGATVNAAQTVKAEASSGGQINVVGSPPEIDVDTSSGGDVDFRSN